MVARARPSRVRPSRFGLLNPRGSSSSFPEVQRACSSGLALAAYVRSNSIDELIAHSLGIVVSVDCEVSARRLNDRRRVPGQRSHGPLVLEAGKNIPGITPLPVLNACSSCNLVAHVTLYTSLDVSPAIKSSGQLVQKKVEKSWRPPQSWAQSWAGGRRCSTPAR